MTLSEGDAGVVPVVAFKEVNNDGPNYNNFFLGHRVPFIAYGINIQCRNLRRECFT